jgi:hypothetical protein
MAATSERAPDATVRVRAETHTMLKALAQREQLPLTQYLDRLAEAEYRRLRLRECNEAFERLRQDPQALAAYNEDLGEFEGTLADGLDLTDSQTASGDADELWEYADTAAR